MEVEPAPNGLENDAKSVKNDVNHRKEKVITNIDNGEVEEERESYDRSESVADDDADGGGDDDDDAQDDQIDRDNSADALSETGEGEESVDGGDDADADEDEDDVEPRIRRITSATEAEANGEGPIQIHYDSEADGEVDEDENEEANDDDAGGSPYIVSVNHNDDDDDDDDGQIGDINEVNLSEQDLDMTEKHRLECLDNMERIEKEFSDLKEKFFREKITTLTREVDEVKAGSHDKFVDRGRELEQKKDEKLWAAEQWRLLQIQNINAIYESDKRQAEEEFDFEKDQLREEMVTGLLDKQRRLQDEKNTMNLIDTSEARVMTRTLRRRGKSDSQSSSSANAFRKKLTPPHINYTLKDHEINEDLMLIQKSRGIRYGGQAQRFADRGRPMSVN